MKTSFAKKDEAIKYFRESALALIEKYKALEAKYERLKPRHEVYVKMLGELLAVLHADGGHYQYEHGTEKAVEDSITKHYELTRQLAELKAENERLNTVPMKYRRMAFNAQLQKENEDFQFRNDRLVQDFADVTEENDALRRIHAENIEIFKRQLAEYKVDAERYRHIKPIIDAFPEINPSNYDHDDACGLNAWGVELVLADEAMKGATK